MACKRNLEVEDFSQLEEVPSTDVHAVVTKVSPLKKARSGNSYFEGYVSDGNSSLRMVGFDSKLQEELESYCNTERAAVLRNCVIQKSLGGDKMEIKLNNRTKIAQSPKKIVINIIHLEDLSSNFGKIVSVKVKIVDIFEPITIGGKQLQEITVSDLTGRCQLKLWEEKIGSVRLDRDQSYLLSNVVVSEYNSEFHLSFVSESACRRTSDIENELSKVMSDAVVFAVDEFNKYHNCYSCNGRVIPPTAGFAGKCADCQRVQRVNKDGYELMAKLFVQNRNDQPIRPKLSASGTVLCKIAEVSGLSEVTEEVLVNAAPFTVTYDDEDVIVSVERP